MGVKTRTIAWNRGPSAEADILIDLHTLALTPCLLSQPIWIHAAFDIMSYSSLDVANRWKVFAEAMDASSRGIHCVQRAGRKRWGVDIVPLLCARHLIMSNSWEVVQKRRWWKLVHCDKPDCLDIWFRFKIFYNPELKENWNDQAT